MKKLGVLFAVSFFFLAMAVTFGQESKEEVVEKVQQQQEKTEVAVADLPEAIQKTLSETYAGYEAKKAYKTNEETPHFYVKLADKEGKWIKVKLDEAGKVLEQKDIETKA